MGRSGQRKIILPFILPALLIYTSLFIYPAIQALWVSLHDWSGFGREMVYIGFGNYREMSRDPLFWGAVFPLGMYTTSTYRLAEAFGLPFLFIIPRLFIGLALTAWLLGFLGLTMNLVAVLRRAAYRHARSL